MPYGRRRRSFNSNSRVPKSAAYKPVTIKQPKVNDLKKILESFVSASQADRLNALAKAAMWYDDGNANGAIAYVLSNRLLPSTDVEFKRSVDRADNCRKRAAGTNFIPEQDTSLRMAIKSYEKCCEKLGVPLLQTYIDAYDAKKAELEAQALANQMKYGEGIMSVQKALGLPLQITFCEHCNQYMAQNMVNGCQGSHPDKLQMILPTIEKLELTDSKTARSINLAEKSLMYNRETAALLTQTVRREGILVAVLRELPALVRYSAVQKAADGQTWTTNRDSHIAFQAQALANLESWLKGAESPNRLVRKGAGVVSASSPSAPRSTGRAGFGGRSKLAPGQLFAPGTGNDRIYQLLKDGNPHDYKEIETAFGSSAVKGYLKSMVAESQARWGFMVTQNGLTYTMTSQSGGAQ